MTYIEITEHLGKWLQESLQDKIKGIWGQKPTVPDYPFLLLEMRALEKNPYENRSSIRFNLTLFSNYEGQKETINILEDLKRILEDHGNPLGCFRIKEVGETKINSDNYLRQKTLSIDGYVQ